MSTYTVKTFEDSLRIRQLKSLEKNLKISQDELVAKLLNDKVLRTTFGFDKEWLMRFHAQMKKQGLPENQVDQAS